jgi:hypothetical protein
LVFSTSPPPQAATVAAAARAISRARFAFMVCSGGFVAVPSKAGGPIGPSVNVTVGLVDVDVLRAP